MKKIRNGLILMMAALFLCLAAPLKGYAEPHVLDSGTYKGISWKITRDLDAAYADQKVLTISGTGAIPDFGAPDILCNNPILPPWLRCPYTTYDGEADVPIREGLRTDYAQMGSPDGTFFSKIVIEPGITEIGEAAFCFSANGPYESTIYDILIPSTVTRIGAGAFLSHADVRQVVIPDSVTVLEGTTAYNRCFDHRATISCSSKSAAYAYAKKRGNPVDLTDMQVTLTINGVTVKSSDYTLDKSYNPPTLSPQPSGALPALQKGQTVSCRATATLGGVAVTPELTFDKTLLSYDAASGTLKAIGGGNTCSVTATVKDPDNAKAIKKSVSFWVKVENPYQITYVLDGGKNNSRNPSEYVKGITVKLKSPTKKGYKFQGWYTSSAGGSKVTQVKDRSLVLYARWKKVTVPKVKKLKAPNQKTKKMVISFGKVQYAKGYQVQYSTKSTFKSGYTKSKSVKTNKLTISSGLKYATYHVRVRAYKLDSKNCKVYGPWSSAVKVKIRK